MEKRYSLSLSLYIYIYIYIYERRQNPLTRQIPSVSFNYLSRSANISFHLHRGRSTENHRGSHVSETTLMKTPSLMAQGCYICRRRSAEDHRGRHGSESTVCRTPALVDHVKAEISSGGRPTWGHHTGKICGWPWGQQFNKMLFRLHRVRSTEDHHGSHNLVSTTHEEFPSTFITYQIYQIQVLSDLGRRSKFVRFRYYQI